MNRDPYLNGEAPRIFAHLYHVTSFRRKKEKKRKGKQEKQMGSGDSE